jgi:hypothetical protein
MLLARLCLKKMKAKMIGIFDRDPAGCQAKKDLDDSRKTHKRNSDVVKGFLLPKPTAKTPHLLELRRAGIEIPITLESLFPSKLWHYAKIHGWLESNHSHRDLIRRLDFSESLFDFCQSKGLSDDDMLYVRYKLSSHHKQEFARHIVNQMLSKDDVPSGLQFLIEEVINFFGEQ